MFGNKTLMFEEFIKAINKGALVSTNQGAYRDELHSMGVACEKVRTVTGGSSPPPCPPLLPHVLSVYYQHSPCANCCTCVCVCLCVTSVPRT